MRETSRAIDKKLQGNNRQTASSYDALCKMLIEFNNNQPLVKGHGGFENVYGDSSASERYTEAKLQKFTEEVL